MKPRPGVIAPADRGNASGDRIKRSSSSFRGFDFHQVTGAFKRLQRNVGDATNLHVIESQSAFDVNATRALLKVGAAEVAGVAIESHAQFGSAFCIGELYVNVVSIDRLFEQFDGSFRTEPCLNRMI